MLLLVISAPVWSMTEARLLQQSRSGRTAIFSVGTTDDIREGDFAIVLKQIRPVNTRDLRVVPAARAKNIKISSDSSIWLLYKIDDPELLVKGDRFILLAETALLKGRRPPKIGQVTLVTDKDSADEDTYYVLSEDKDRLSKLKDKYQVIAPTHGKEVRSDSDATLVNVDTWEKIKSTKHRSALYKSPHAEEFRRSLKLETFEKLVTAYVQKVNDPKFNYDAFYENQMKSDFSNEFRKKTNFETEYEEFLHKEALKSSADAKLYRSLLEKGESWSEDFSDEELKVVLTQVSVLQETDRRQYVMAKPKRYSVIGEYGWSLTDAQTSQDSKRESLYSLNLDFEVIPFLGHETLERFTFNGMFRSNKSAFESDNTNVWINETSVGLGANWYPVALPSTFEHPVYFLGTYVRSGLASATTAFGEKANYTLMSVPGFRLGMKYFMRSNFGLRIVASMETLQLERYESSSVENIPPERANLVEGKIGVGVGYTF